MKINDILQQASSFPVSKKEGKKEGVDFQQFLKDAEVRHVEGHPNISAAPSGHAGEILSSNGLPEINQADPYRLKEIQAAEKTLSILEDYQNALGDPRTTLRQIESIVRLLSLEVKSLNGLADKIPSADPLQKIMTEVEIVSAVEIEKFNRGEYV